MLQAGPNTAETDGGNAQVRSQALQWYPPQQLRFTTYYRSAILFGGARLLTNEAAKRVALQKPGEKYAPGNDSALQAEIEKELKRTLVIETTIEHISGKEAIELARPYP